MRDPCQTSIDLLRGRIEPLLRSRAGASRIWFADARDPFPDAPAAGIVDVVLFGNFLRRFVDCAAWPETRVRIWVLCAAARDILCDLLGVPQRNVAVLPREAVYPSHPAPHAWPAPSGEFALVYAGRLSPAKNIGLLLRTVSALQWRERIPVTLHLFGEFDDWAPADRGEREVPGYRRSMLGLADRLEWTHRPVFHGQVAPEDWVRADLRDPVLVNLSTFYCEDFGVSLGQAREAGWPAIVTDWGGLREAPGPRILKIPAPAIGETSEPEWKQDLLAGALAARIARRLRSPDPGEDEAGDHGGGATEPASDFPEPPRAIPVAELRAIRGKALGKYGATMDRVGAGLANEYACTPEGGAFFELYRERMAGPAREATLVVINDHVDPSDPVLRALLETASSATRALVSMGEDPLFVALRDSARPGFRAFFPRARRIVVPFASGQLPLLINGWRRGLRARAPIRILARRETLTSHADPTVELIRSSLGPGDRFVELHGEVRPEDLG